MAGAALPCAVFTPLKILVMPADLEFVVHCLELLSALGRPRAKRMFGGHGIYVDERFMALATGHQLFLKTDALNRQAFEQAGCHPFEFNGADGQRVVMSYWSAPDDAMDSPAQMLPWARLAMAAALRAANTKARPSAARAKTRPVAARAKAQPVAPRGESKRSR